MLAFLITCGVMLLIIALVGIRIILVPDGEFHGTCSTNNQQFLRNEDDSCPVCGKSSEETCPNQPEDA